MTKSQESKPIIEIGFISRQLRRTLRERERERERARGDRGLVVGVPVPVVVGVLTLLMSRMADGVKA